jgi:hypothetical protein
MSGGALDEEGDYLQMMVNNIDRYVETLQAHRSSMLRYQNDLRDRNEAPPAWVTRLLEWLPNAMADANDQQGFLYTELNRRRQAK